MLFFNFYHFWGSNHPHSPGTAHPHPPPTKYTHTLALAQFLFFFIMKSDNNKGVCCNHPYSNNEINIESSCRRHIIEACRGIYNIISCYLYYVILSWCSRNVFGTRIFEYFKRTCFIFFYLMHTTPGKHNTPR